MAPELWFTGSMSTTHAELQISDDLIVSINHRSVGQIEPAAAFDLAERLVRAGMRKIFSEEGGRELINALERED